MTAVAISAIRADQQAQPRSAISTDLVGEYSQAMINGAEFPPLIVFREAAVYWLADGFHRFYAYQGCERTEVDCDVREGTLRDAILHSVGANAVHGLRRTNEDKCRAVMRLTGLEGWGWGEKSNRDIARQCGVSPALVDRLCPEPSANERQIASTRPVTRNGTTYQMNTAAIGRRAETPAPVARAAPFDSARAEQDQRDQGAAPPNSEESDREQRLRESMTQGDPTIFDNLFEIERVFQRLPEPLGAAREFPRRLSHPFSSERFAEIGHWFLEFSRAWGEAFDVAAE